MKIAFSHGAVSLLAVLLTTDSRGAEPTQAEKLGLQARDVLVQHCFGCHGKNPKNLRGNLNLFDQDQREDKARQIVVPGKPDQSELLKLVESGKMPPGKRGKVTDAEQKTLRAWITAGAPTFPNPTDGTAVAARVKEVFRTRCLECHGGAKTNAGVKILDRDLLVEKKKIVPGKPDESLLVQLVTAQDDSAMPPTDQPRLGAEDIETIRAWIASDAPALPADVVVPEEKDKDPALKDVAGVDYVLKKILEHTRTLAVADKPYYRYFSINHLLTGGATRAELDLHREAFAKAINHLSWEKKLVRPTAIDEPVSTVFAVDLRELSWHRQPFVRIVDKKPAGKSKVNLFDLALLEYPYSTIYESSETFDRLVEEFLIPADQVRPIAYVRADWFVSTATQPPLYEDFLQLPFELKELETRLEVDSTAHVADSIARRAGMTVSGVSRNNRVVERHPTKLGAYWKSFDFRTSKGTENMFRDPLVLHPAGGEMIFSLPNGLQGYFVSDAKGRRVTAAPTDIVTDKFADDKTVRNGLACIRCHDSGMKSFADNVRSSLEALPGSPGFDKRHALRLYVSQKEMDKLLQEDGDRFQNAMKELLGKLPTREPLVPVTHRFLDGPLHLASAGAELGLPKPAELKNVFRLPQFAGLGLVPLASEGVVRRDMWEDYYDQVVRSLALGMPVVPIDGLTRREYQANPHPFEVELKTSKKNNVFEPGDEAVIFVVNKSNTDLHIELSVTGTKGERVIMTPAGTVVKARQQYRYPAEGKLKVQPNLGKEQITLFASDKALPAADLLRGPGLSDRVVHRFYELHRDGKRFTIRHDPANVVKKTIDIETK